MATEQPELTDGDLAQIRQDAERLAAYPRHVWPTTIFDVLDAVSRLIAEVERLRAALASAERDCERICVMLAAKADPAIDDDKFLLGGVPIEWDRWERDAIARGRGIVEQARRDAESE